MLAFVRYQLISLVRSLKFIPPATAFLAWIFILFAYNNAPILSSYAISSIALYLLMTWMAMAIFTLEEESEKHILFTQLGSKVKFLIGKWLTSRSSGGRFLRPKNNLAGVTFLEKIHLCIAECPFPFPCFVNLL